MAGLENYEMFRPPLAHGMKTLDRAVFHRTVRLNAARIYDNKQIFSIRSRLEKSKDALVEPRLGSVHPDPDTTRAGVGKKCILLRPQAQSSTIYSGEYAETNGTTDRNDLQPAMSKPYSPVVADLINQELISVVAFDLNLDYKYWTYHDIMSSILPPKASDEIPSGFSQVGHVAHLNLREAYLPYKHLIASILLDKNPTVKTVINKIDDVGEENEFRTFKYEVLAGPDDLNVTVSEEDCIFSFDYSKVYWNTRLNTEHRRLVTIFGEGDAVCDVMAGIGPFAVPAGKKGVFVWANDLNPDSYYSLTKAVKKNKVEDYVRPFNVDGRAFIRDAAAQLLTDDRKIEIKKKTSRKDKTANEEVVKTLVQPKTFQHFVLNLPASALTFLSSFVGLYTDKRANIPHEAPMPIVHAYCFSTKDEQEVGQGEYGSRNGGSSNATSKICAEISRQLDYSMTSGRLSDGGVEIFDVRDVAPKKRMFCASFALPAEVAFRPRTS